MKFYISGKNEDMYSPIIYKYVWLESKKRGQWIDNTIKKHIPKWKFNLISRTKSKLVCKLLGVNLEIKEYIDSSKFVIILNGKTIGSRIFKP